jgi:iron complex transport system substrate-binding protein
MHTAIITTFLAALAALISPPAVGQPAPARIVSINLCADELLLALANPGQIVALSPYAADPALSFMAEEARAFRHDAAEAETVVDLDPDLVLAGRFTRLATREMLTRLGYRVVLLDPARSVDDSIAQIRQVAEAVGHPGRADSLIRQIEAARVRGWVSAAAEPVPTAAVYQRRGYVTGGATLTGELLSIAGFRNLGDVLAGERGGFVRLEALIAGQPDYLVVAARETPVEDQGAALLAHPALAARYPAERRIVLPERLTVCGGPSLPDAIDWLAAEARRVRSAP